MLFNFLFCNRYGRGFCIFAAMSMVGLIADQTAAAALGGLALGGITTVAS